MTGRRKATVIAVGMLVSGPPAWAQHTPEAAQAPAVKQYLDRETGLSLREAIAGALEREPELRGARAEIEAARGMRLQRSEERRVGKECRSRWGAYRGKKKSVLRPEDR